MNDEHRSSSLADQKDALSLYIDAMLRDEAQLDESVAEAVTTTPVMPSALLQPVIAPAPLMAPAVEAVDTEQEALPRWAESNFQALLFKVAGLTLAVPLVELSGIQEWQADSVTPMPGHVSWYLGLMPYRERTVPVIDTAELVLPADRLARMQPAIERLQRVVFIDDGRWGLACDEVAEVITLEPEQVRWRSNRTRRRWLAGTVIEQMCAIIDPPAFARMLATGIEDVPAIDESDEAKARPE